jgi:Zn-dependent protease with chaperone function
MDFFDRQERAQKQTRLLIWLFGLAVLAIVVVTYLILAACIQPFLKPLPGATRHYPLLFTVVNSLGMALLQPLDYLRWLCDARLACFITLGTLTSITLGCLYKIRQLSDGGPALAELLGGRRVEPNPSDPDKQRLRNVVEEMAIASGMSVPEIYVLDNERGINSFAAGHTRNDVAIGVTRGCLKLLTRDELQGVIAHEFSHVLNGDTRLNMLLMGLAHGLFWPTILGRVLMRGTSQPPEIGESFLDDNARHVVLPTAPIGVLFLIIGGVSLPFVRLLKSAICRQREWLADAAAVQFTRNPAGITGVLKKIGGLYKHGRLDTPHAETASHLYFAGLDFDPWLTFLSTHPPLKKRILAVDPMFDGQFPRVKTLAPTQYEREQAFEKGVGAVMAVERTFPEMFLAGAGSMTADGIRQANLMRLGVPLEVKQVMREPAGAAGVVYSLLLSEDDSVRAKQNEILRANLDAASFEQTTALAPQIEALGTRYKLALAEFAVPALRQHSPADSAVFRQTLQQLIECDGVIELFEYALMKMVTRQLRSHFDGPDSGKACYGSVKTVLPQCALLLSALAHVGQQDEQEARAAFAKGLEFLDAPGAKIQFLTRREWNLTKVDTTLARLAQTPPAVQRNILLACGKTVASDGHVTEREAALLRAIADSLDCPVPPFVDAIRMEEMAAEA